MKLAFLTIGAAAVALSAAPAASRQYSSVIKCSGWRGSECVAWNRLTLKQTRKIGVGFVFPQNYTYTEVSALPQSVVTQYSLTQGERYVYINGYLYVVDPKTYAVTRVIQVPGQ